MDKFGGRKVGQARFASGITSNGKGKISGSNSLELRKMANFASMMQPLFMGNIIHTIFSRIQLEFSKILIKNLKDSIKQGGWHSHNWITSIIAKKNHKQLISNGSLYNSFKSKPIVNVGNSVSFWVGVPSEIKAYSGSGKVSKYNLAQIANIQDKTGSRVKVTKKMQNFFYYILYKNLKTRKKFGGDKSYFLMYQRVLKMFPIGKVIVTKPRPFFNRALEKTYAEFPIYLHFRKLLQIQLAKKFSFMK